MGVARLLRGLYGSEPQIDIEEQWARVRVPGPVTFDFVALDKGFTRNNYKLTGIRIRVEVEVETAGARATIPATGQSFPIRGEPPGECPGVSAAARRWLRVLDWQDPEKTGVEVHPDGAVAPGGPAEATGTQAAPAAEAGPGPPR